MAYRNEYLQELMGLVARLPNGCNFSNSIDRKVLEIHAATQEEVQTIRPCFPGTFWKKEWLKNLNWWEYTTEYAGWRIRIWADRDGPPSCKAIVEKRKVKRDVPVAYESREIEEEVIVGWDCGQKEETKAHE